MDTTTSDVPELHTITKSHVEGIGHRDDTLFVRFKGGRTYRYANVSVDEFGELLQADSKGRALQRFISAPDDYPCALCVEEDDE